MNVHSVERLTLESQLRGALEREELVLHYQPIVDVKSGYITGMEALVRWQHAQSGLLLPENFIDLAEETGLIVPIGEWVLEAACKQQREWHALDMPPVKVAVNLSPRQFVHRDLVQDIVRVVSKTECDTNFLELEITEGTVMHNAARAVALLGQLKEMGIRIAIDDFGTGYSSLAYLKRFPIDSLKIDRSFIADIPARLGQPRDHRGDHRDGAPARPQSDRRRRRDCRAARVPAPAPLRSDAGLLPREADAGR